jgi:hypothetical protein
MTQRQAEQDFSDEGQVSLHKRNVSGAENAVPVQVHTLETM